MLKNFQLKVKSIRLLLQSKLKFKQEKWKKENET